MSFEKGISELNRIVSNLASDSIDLETSIADFEKGMKIQHYCEQKINEAIERVNLLLPDDKALPLHQKPLQQSPRQDESLDFSDLE